MKKVAKVKQPLVKPKEGIKSQPQEFPSQYPGNNASLIDFVPRECKGNKDDEFVEVAETSGPNQIRINESETKQSGFSFINPKKPSTQTGNSLIDLDSYESQKSNQIKQLTESISNVYNNNSEESTKTGTNRMNNLNMMQLNQPNINISNTFYNMGGLNNYNMRPFNSSGYSNMGMNMVGNGYYHQGMGMNNGYTNNSYGMQAPMGVPNMPSNTSNNMYSLKEQYPQNTYPNTSRPNMNTIPTNQTFNYEYYNNLKNTQPSLGSNTNSGAFSSRKKEEDPFKSLLSFK